MLTLRYHPFTRAAAALRMLEEVEQPYELDYVDISAGAHKQPGHTQHNRMGKVPVLLADGVAISELAAIGVWLADRYAPGRLAPALDDPQRGPYLRWCFFSPSVIEPAAASQANGWEYRASAMGWGTYADMLDTLEEGLSHGPWLLGERFSMADVIVGSAAAYLLQFKMLEPRPAFTAYVARLNATPAAQRTQAIQARWIEEKGLG